MDPVLPPDPASPASAGSAAPDAPLIKDGTTQSFGADVMEASADIPVIVDFWAPWCGPCKQLTPALEKAVLEARGAVRLVKINADENKELAAQLRIQSIPTVYAFFKGHPIDGFSGAMPQGQIKEFIEKILSQSGAVAPENPVEEILDHAKAAFQANDFPAAAEIFAQVLSLDPASADGVAGLISCYVALGKLEEGRMFLDQIPEDLKEDSAVCAARARLDLAEKSGTAIANREALAARIAANPDDYEARFDMALALFADNQAEEAIEALLVILRQDIKWNDEAARKQLLEFFEVLGPSHRLAISGRRQLSALLFS